ncbi:hypothetical protein CLAFUW4_04984 [Fulvia fulva]|uniref:Uncharacterized protein n=1 Tax=Passalora fulva TaxID=5499 RepID=A0A9Q8UUW8_PASFU|nr:uncharacterized protein CLAFUR5_11923 [Fulvia fulva]KAK4626507.1 hypothetical protein CLAFUR4_04970 [Fulvia fulva]KAK4628545.1 hypothetical protein CLAFUR0_04974 [Fulvia fulva]UJO23202.1 hypothetical protein CLAFUR5_11923 [Fulvia fulva]WPV13567.1 hypothetical protein CLAFUW4_04984 [Fulvia fulva]WPV28822.1 hypothetical protein CLAFUW7_04978 [Fulvia fulva]
MSSPNSTPTAPWQDRRGMFQRGKEVHEPARKMSGSGGTGVIEAVRRASTSSQSDKSLVSNPLSNDPASPASPSTTARRRSSAASSGLFSNLTHHKRGSEDYADRRASQTEGYGQGGAVSGWFNKTFRGIQSPAAPGQTQQEKRGVME